MCKPEAVLKKVRKIKAMPIQYRFFLAGGGGSLMGRWTETFPLPQWREFRWGTANASNEVCSIMLVSTSLLLHNYQSYWVGIEAVKSMLYMDCLKRVKHPLMANMPKDKSSPSNVRAIMAPTDISSPNLTDEYYMFCDFFHKRESKMALCNQSFQQDLSKSENCNFLYDSCWCR